MNVLHVRCCGLDVHKKTVVACVRIQESGAPARKTVRSFGTTTADLLRLHDWLTEMKCTHVAMESTGVYWKPIYFVLEDAFDVALVNAQHIKAVPGRKTDVKDCEWIADLLAHGLVRKSFVPPPPTRVLRELTRYRRSVTMDRVAEVNRIHKLLEAANIKLGNVVSDVLGVTGRAILRALIAGERDPQVLAQLAKGRLCKQKAALAEAVVGRFDRSHAFLLGKMLDHVEYMERLTADCDAQITELLQPEQDQVERLMTIPGVGRRTAEILLAEIGSDMSRFETCAHLASWARICPGNHESAGKRYSGKTGHGNNWLRTALVECAWSTTRTKNTYLAAQFRRIARRRGPKKAALAVAHSILVAVYFILRDRVNYRELGGDYFDRIGTTRLLKYHVRRLEELGLKVVVAPQAQAA